MQEVILHLGLQKTATTLFQQEVFPKLQGIKFYNKPKIVGVLNKSIPFTGNKILISEEGWSHTFTDKGKLPPPSEINYEFALLKKLHKRFPHAKIILGVRERESWIKSLFSRFYLETEDANFEKFRKEINPEFTKQFRYVNQIIEYFGLKNVFVYDFDRFLQDKQKVVKDMCDFMNADVPKNIDLSRKFNVSLFKWENGKCILKEVKMLSKDYSELPNGAKIFRGAHISVVPVASTTRARNVESKWKDTIIGSNTVVYPGAVIHANVKIGKNCLICCNVAIREGVTIGDNCIIANGVTINYNANIGDNVKIMDNTHITGGMHIEKNVFISCLVATSNDNSMGKHKGTICNPPYIASGARIGAGANILPGVTVNENAVVAAGAVVTKVVEKNDTVMGIPARVKK